eukprot:TRINITY_DN14501_c0_g2_i2.p1 TRINITY_DN14501_c0_g2~~TRINITY_DN14501_c0_g2_i2.p1  ORF type:complete len:302 (-),score=67.63 TRINITY_DN14501_c0_g2_i2:31-936(-)
MLERQYFPYSLNQRIVSMPILTAADKLWIAFQLTCAVCQVHKENLYHGDIKTENVVVTSWNWVFLTDFAPYKPTYLLSESLGDYQFFYTNETNKIHGCYLAPEKFDPPEPRPSASLPAVQAMDIFSLGCVLAELFLNGVFLFDLSRLQAYKNGKFDPSEILREIKPTGMRDLIVDMLQLDARKRKTAKEYVQAMANDAMPPFITQFAYYFMGVLLHPALASSDRKVAMVFKHLDVIWKCCFNKEVPLVEQSMNDCVFEAIRCVPVGDIISCMKPDELPYCVKYKEQSKSLTEIIPVSESMK